MIATVVPIESNADSAAEMLRGVADAQTRLNDEGGLNGQLLEVIVANDGNDPQKAEQIAKQLANTPNLLGVVGHNSSSASAAALVEYEKAGIPMISPTSTSTALSGDTFFRTLPSDAINGQRLAEYARNILSLDRVVIFYNPNSSYSQSLTTAFADSFQGQVVDTIDLSAPFFDADRAVQDLQGQTDALVLFPNTDHTTTAIAIARANNNQMQLLGGDALYKSDTLSSGGNAVVGLTLAVPWFAEGDYAQTSSERWGGQVSWRTAMSFDATQALINALSNNASPSTVLQNLKNTRLDPTDTAGEVLEFETTGNRQGEAILVEAVKGGVNQPANTPFSFQKVEPLW